MARPRLQAVFFATANGIVTKKAPPLTTEQRRVIFDRDQGKCRKCKCEVRFGGNDVSPFDTIKSGHIDHTFPRSRGGRNDPSNLQLLCMSCNMRKGAD